MPRLIAYAVLAVAAGGAIGILSGPGPLTTHLSMLLIPLLAVGVAGVSLPRLMRMPEVQQLDVRRQVLMSFGLIALSCGLVVLAEFVILLNPPSADAIAVGCCLGLLTVSRWFRSDGGVAAVKISVMLVYLASAVTVISTLVTDLPPSVFWVISAIIPAWRARQLAILGQLAESLHMLDSAARVYAGVLAMALWLPALLLYR